MTTSHKTVKHEVFACLDEWIIYIKSIWFFKYIQVKFNGQIDNICSANEKNLFVDVGEVFLFFIKDVLVKN